MKKKWLILITIIGIVLLCGIIAGPLMSNVETPEYDVITSQHNIEIRRYASMIIAKTKVTGQRKEAIRAGFRLLADYIFGNNMAQQDIAMTAPVQQKHVKVAMTAPVVQQAVNDTWQIHFILPSKYTIQTLPKPNNKRVKLEVILPKTFAVIRFSGGHSDANIEKHKRDLLDYVSENKIKTLSSPQYAFYNPPWTLPLFRRNEIMIEVNWPTHRDSNKS